MVPICLAVIVVGLIIYIYHVSGDQVNSDIPDPCKEGGRYSFYDTSGKATPEQERRMAIRGYEPFNTSVPDLNPVRSADSGVSMDASNRPVRKSQIKTPSRPAGVSTTAAPETLPLRTTNLIAQRIASLRAAEQYKLRIKKLPVVYHPQLSKRVSDEIQLVGRTSPIDPSRIIRPHVPPPFMRKRVPPKQHPTSTIDSGKLFPTVGRSKHAPRSSSPDPRPNYTVMRTTTPTSETHLLASSGIIPSTNSPRRSQATG